MGVTIGATWRIRLVDMCGGDDEPVATIGLLLWRLVVTSFPIGMQNTAHCMYVCMYVCLRAYLKKLLM